MEVQVTQESAEARVEIALTPACSIRGRVRDRFGKPVEGCELNVNLKSRYGPSPDASWWRMFEDTGRSDAEGELRLEALPFGAYRIEARKDGFSTRVGRLTPNLFLDADEISFDTGSSSVELVPTPR